MLLAGLVIAMTLTGQRPVITHDISTGSLNIASAQFGNDYIITGTTFNTYRVIVQSGYQGTLTLQNLNITSASLSCITIQGLNNQSNLSPVTKVDIVLDGDNDLQFTGSTYCALQVDQGAQIHISAIDPNDNSSGTLFANSTSYVKGTPIVLDPLTAYPWAMGNYAGAGIGAPLSVVQGNATMVCDLGKLPGTSACNNYTAGGNIIISSGTIFAHGGHGAGIGGGFQTYYDGIIIITGGDIQSYAQAHGAGIGSGCPCSQGVDNCYGPNSAIIVLPPAEIKAAGGPNVSPYHWMYQTQYALAGMANIIYLNDPNKSLITVFTEDTLPNANIYLDLTQMQDVVDIFNALGLGWYDLAKVRIGRTDAVTGMLDFRAELQQPTTFFTDASSINPATFGRPYMPETRVITGNAANRDTVILLLLPADISFTDYPSTPLEVGYTSTEAMENAFHTKVSYNDATSMTNVSYVLQDGIDFSSLIFLDSDSLTPISPPATLTNGMVFYIIFPIDVGKPLGVYSDVLLIDGVYGGVPLPGYIRKIGMQRVVFDDSYDNDYIRVTANPDNFITTYPTTNTVDLTLNIDHTGTGVLYDYLDVVAMYLVTPIAGYSAAIAANPLYSSGWQPMNVPLTNNGFAVTTVDFSAMPAGTYYIHWYVESGVVYAHSLDVTDPPRLYGGFGPYSMKLDPWEIWNWSDLSQIIDKQAEGYDEFILMQHLGIPGEPATYGDAFSNPACPWAGTNAAYGWYGYEGFGDGVSGFNMNTPLTGSTLTSAFATYKAGTQQDAFGWEMTTSEGWTPIGTFVDYIVSANTPFIHHFDGNSKTITGLWINRAASGLGLFGVVGGNAYIHDLTIALGRDDATWPRPGITNAGHSIGGLAGTFYTANILENPVLENITIKGTYAGSIISGTGDNAGGIVGLFHNGIMKGTIVNEVAITMVNGTRTGGITGCLDFDVINSSGIYYATIASGSILENKGVINGEMNTGGIIGLMGSKINQGTTFSGIDNLNGNILIKNSGDVNGTSSVGGVFGFFCQATVKDYVNTVKVTGSAYSVGGICGDICGAFINDCTNTGAITCTGTGEYGGAGGIVGMTYQNTNVTLSGVAGCYNLGALTGPNSGGIVACLQNGTTVTNVYNLGSISGANSGGVIGLLQYFSISNTVTNVYNAGRIVTPGSKGVIGDDASSGNVTLSNLFFDTTTSGVTDGGHSSATGLSTSAMTGLTGLWRTVPWGAAIPDKATYPYLARQVAGDARDNLDFRNITPMADGFTVSINATIDLTGMTSPAKFAFNTFATTPVNYYQPLTTLPPVNILALSSSYVPTGATPVSVGVMSETDIVAFNLNILPDINVQIINCNAVDTVDVASLLPSLPCSLSSLTLTVNSPSVKGATMAVVNKKIVYNLLSSNFTGADTIYYSITCGVDVYEGQANLIVVECPDNIIDSDCKDDPPTVNWDYQLLMTSPSTDVVCNYSIPLIGDIDYDGKPEIVVPATTATGFSVITNAIYIFEVDGNNITRQQKLDIPYMNLVNNSYSIANVDGGNYAALFIATTITGNSTLDQGQLIKYTYDGIQYVESWRQEYSNMNTRESPQPMIVDFNNDGIPEVLVYDKIYNARTGDLLVDGGYLSDATKGFGLGGHAVSGHPSWAPAVPHAYASMMSIIDIDGDGIPEVIGGNCVYKINIVNTTGITGNSFVLHTQASTTGHPEVRDGATAVADINGDGLIEVIVTAPPASNSNTSAALYIWNPRTGEVLNDNIVDNLPRSMGEPNGVSVAFIGDIDKDGQPEICLTGDRTMRAFGYNSGTRQIVQKWSRTTTDTSGATTMVMFDFDQDGNNELVYRDVTTLRIINGIDGSDKIISGYPCYSSTANEYPVVVDINNDGAAEIIVTGGTSSAVSTARVMVFSSKTVQDKWAPTRKVWNQFAYNVVNVNENLTIPKVQMNPAHFFPNGKQPFNGYLMQQTMLDTNGDPLWLLPDATPVETASSAVQDGDSVLITLTITNQGDAAIGSPIHYTLYKESIPTGYIMNDSAQVQLVAGATEVVTFKVAISLIQPAFKLLVRINDMNGQFPFQPECKDGNNVIEFINPALNQLMLKDAVLLPSFANNGTLANPVSVLFNEYIEYTITAVNANINNNTTVTIRDTLPAYLNYFSASPTPVSQGPLGVRYALEWSIPNLASMASTSVKVTATPQSGAVASQPLFDNRAWVVVSDTIIVPTNHTWHQGADVNIVTFSTGFGGSIYQAQEQILDYRTSPKAGIVIAPDEGYRFTGWSHEAYLSLRGELIPAQHGIIQYDTLTIYGNVNLNADFEAEIYPITYYLNGGHFPPVIARNEAISSYTIESTVITLSAPEKAGDVFTGWTGSNGDEPQLTVTIPQGSTGEKVYIANYLLSGCEDIDVQPILIPSDDLIWAVKNELFVRTSKAGNILRIYTLDGVLQQQQAILHPGETKYKLANGLYVVTLNNGIGQKVMIK